MTVDGYLLFVLHGHLPFVRHPEPEYPPEENWLFEAITECYIPLIELCEDLRHDGIRAPLTFNLTPCLIEMLEDRLLQEHYLRYLNQRIDFLDEEILKKNGSEEIVRLARLNRGRFQRCREVYDEVWGRDLVSRFRRLQDEGQVSILASAATHAYLPLWEVYPELVELQIRIGLEVYRKNFQRPAVGFWLPECGFFRGADQFLQRHGIRYSFVEDHGVLNADHRPRYAQVAPIHTESGVAMFARDAHWVNRIWRDDVGYPGDDCYLDFFGDIGFVWDPEYVFELTHYRITRIPTGIRYYCRRNRGSRELYDPEEAGARCDRHAEEFVREFTARADQQHGRSDRPPLMVVITDMEHFGHGWQEGLIWLDRVIRRLADQAERIRMITAEEYLMSYPASQIANPSASSWGVDGYNRTWLMERNDWMYPELYAAAGVVPKIVRDDDPSWHDKQLARNQYLRELLLAQSSDWAYMMYRNVFEEYANRRVKTHLANMEGIRSQWEADSIHRGWVASLAQESPIFLDIDLWDLYGCDRDVRG